MLRLLTLLAALALISAPAFAQDAGDAETPKKPPVEKDGTPDDDADKEVRIPEIAPPSGGNPMEKLVDDIQQNMKRIEELLKNQDTGGSTQDLQSDTVDKIDELIRLAEQAASQSSGSSSGGRNPSQSSSQSDSQSSQNQKQGEKQEQVDEQGEQPKDEKKQGQKDEPQQGDQSKNDRTSEGNMSENEVGDLKKRSGTGRWGRLPKRVVEQMYENGRRKLPARYRVLLEEYFRRLPE